MLDEDWVFLPDMSSAAADWNGQSVLTLVACRTVRTLSYLVFVGACFR
jgi:hypothetical protein